MKIRLKMDFVIQVREPNYFGFKEKTIKAHTEFYVVSYKSFMSESDSCDRIIGSGVIIKNNDLVLAVSLEEFRTLFEEI